MPPAATCLNKAWVSGNRKVLSFKLLIDKAKSALKTCVVIVLSSRLKILELKAKDKLRVQNSYASVRDMLLFLDHTIFPSECFSKTVK